MSQEEIENLIKKSTELRESGRLEESILSARRATNADPSSANAWWQLALSVAQKDGEESSLEYYKKTVEIAEEFGYGWYKLGNAYKKKGEIKKAIESWEKSLEYDEELELARYNLIDEYNLSDNPTEKKKIIDHLIPLEKDGKLRVYDYHLLAIQYHNNGDFLNAIPYYKKYIEQRNDVYGYTNLAIAYSSSQVGQDLDAADYCKLALEIDSGHERAQKHLKEVSERLNNLKKRALKNEEIKNIIAKESWYENYLNPFELLQINQIEDYEEVEIKEIQKAKRKLLQEIELEDGKVEWLPDLKIDKSRAIKIADEITNEKLSEYHGYVYRYKPLLNFLSKGDLTLFIYDENAYPDEIINTIRYDEEFAKWLSEKYFKQYDLVFTNAFIKRNIDILEIILDGRRYVIPEHEDKCFTNAVRSSENLLDGLKNFQENVKKVKPTLKQVKELLEKDNVGKILEILPPAFQEVQTNAAEIIRDISVQTYNNHVDADLAREILKLASNFAKKSPSFRFQMEKDLAQLDELIREERKNETHLNFGDIKFNITKDGVKYGEKFISANDVQTVRWGTVITGTQSNKIYEFKMVVGGVGSKTIEIKWKTSSDLEKQEDLFQKSVTALFTYVIPGLLERISNDFKRGGSIYVGGVAANLSGVTLKAQGWFSNKDISCPWNSLSSQIVNGSVIITTSVNSKARAELSLSDIDNAWILHIIIQQGIFK